MRWMSCAVAPSSVSPTRSTKNWVELAGEAGDVAELRRLADGGSRDAVDELVQLAIESGDRDELRRLAGAGSRDAADALAELEEVDDE